MGRKVAVMTRQLEDTAEPSRLGAGGMPGMERRSAMDAVRMRIGMAISLGLLKPGERLPDQEDVALGLSVSPITARRALASLAEQGVVVRRRGRAGEGSAAAYDRQFHGVPFQGAPPGTPMRSGASARAAATICGVMRAMLPVG